MSRLPSLKRHIDQWEAQRQERDEARRLDEWAREVDRAMAKIHEPVLARVKLAERMRCLAHNLRITAGLEWSAVLRADVVEDHYGLKTGDVWMPNCDGRGSPGWVK